MDQGETKLKAAPRPPGRIGKVLREAAIIIGATGALGFVIGLLPRFG